MKSTSLTLHYNPVSTYSQKALIALYEKGAEFKKEILNLQDPAAWAAYKDLYPLGKIPLLIVGDGHLIPESTIIIEYLDENVDGPRLIPTDPELARRTRFLTAFADNYINNSFQTIFFDGRKPEADREPKRVAAAIETVKTVLRFLEGQLGEGPWLLGETFSMADCALLPPLTYMAKDGRLEATPNLAAYVRRSVERPSIAQVHRDMEPFMAAIFGG